MTEPEWMRQRGLACEFCGGPGHLVPIPEPLVLAVAEMDTAASALTFDTAVACPEHRFLVLNRRLRLKDERRFAERDHGRPVLGEEPYPARIRRDIGTIIRRLHDWDGPEDGR